MIVLQHGHILLHHLILSALPAGMTILLIGVFMRRSRIAAAGVMTLIACGMVAVPLHLSGLIVLQTNELNHAIATNVRIAPVATIITVSLGLVACTALMLMEKRGLPPRWMLGTLTALASFTFIISI